MNFFTTCGRGTEIFVALEIQQLLYKELVERVHVSNGKVYFKLSKASEEIACIHGLKFCERVFIEIYHSPAFRVCSIKQGIWALKSCLEKIPRTTWDEVISRLRTFREMVFLENSELSTTKKKCVELSSFRVSAKCSGKPSKFFDVKYLSSITGCKLAELLKLKTDLRSPDFEIFIHLNDDGLLIGIPCCSQPLSKRSYIKQHGLRNTVASILASLCNLKPEMVLLDPMCGKGTILLEAAAACKEANIIGGDISLSTCEKAKDNIYHSKGIGSSIQLIQCDVKSIPLPARLVDVIVCDMPFGKKHSLTCKIEDILNSFDRVLKEDGRCIILSGSQTVKEILSASKELLSNCQATSNISTTENKSLQKNQSLQQLLDDIRYLLGYDNMGAHSNKLLSEISSDIDVSRFCLQESLSDIGISRHSIEQPCCPTNEPNKHSSEAAWEDLDDSKLSSELSSIKWKKELVHYLKLGETDAYVCVFTKLM